MISSTISLLSWQRLSFWSSLSTLRTNFSQIFRIFSSSQIIVCTIPPLTSNCVLIVSIDTRRSLSMKFFIWPINSGVLIPTPLIILYRLPAFVESLMPLKNWCSIHPRWSKRNLKYSIRFCCIFPNLKHNFIAYRSSKVSSRPNCIVEIQQLWKSGFSRVYSNCCCSCSFKAEIIKISQSSYNMYSNKILNFQESTTILNACTVVWKLIEGISMYVSVYICICVCMYVSIYIYIY